MWPTVLRSARLIWWGLIFIFGLIWRFLDVIGRGKEFWELPHFADGIQTFVVAHQEVGYQIAPWVLMFVSLAALILMQWPGLLTLWRRPVAPTRKVAPRESDHAPPALKTLRANAAKVPLYEAYEWLKDRSAWRAQYDREHKGQKPFPPLAPIPELKRAMRDGDLKVYGRASGFGPYVQIPATYWLSAELNLGAFFDYGNVGKTEISVPGVEIYDRLVVNSADIFALWPAIDIAVVAKAITDEMTMPPDCPDCKYVNASGNLNLCTNPQGRNHASGTWPTCINVRADVDLCGKKAKWFISKSR